MTPQPSEKHKIPKTNRPEGYIQAVGSKEKDPISASTHEQIDFILTKKKSKFESI